MTKPRIRHIASTSMTANSSPTTTRRSSAAGTRVRIDTDLAVLGKIGEFGQPVIKKKADALLEEFARNLRSTLAA